MTSTILNHYRAFSTYTHPGLCGPTLRSELPDDVRALGLLVRKNIIHPTTLAAGNTGTNADLRFGDMKQVPWWRQPEDDILVTAVAMLAELYRRDARGITDDRQPQDKLVVSCRFVAVLVASILKCKGVAARVRAGNAPYFGHGTAGAVSTDHWINQYWSDRENRWVTIDVDGSLSLNGAFDAYDMPPDQFDFPADAWLGIRSGRLDAQRFYNAKPERGVLAVLWSLFYDFHCLMNNEVIYTHRPRWTTPEGFRALGAQGLGKIDRLARLLQEPDDNFDKLTTLWETERDFRLLHGGLL